MPETLGVWVYYVKPQDVQKSKPNPNILSIHVCGKSVKYYFQSAFLYSVNITEQISKVVANASFSKQMPKSDILVIFLILFKLN